MDRIDKAIISALKDPRDERLLDAILDVGQPAYDRIVSSMYGLPGDSHPQPVDDRMNVLVVAIARRDRTIILTNITHKDPHARYRVIAAACCTNDSTFADIIVERLCDRSYTVLDLVLWVIDRRDYLRTDRAVAELRKLLISKRSDHLMMKKIDIKRLADRIENELAIKR